MNTPKSNEEKLTKMLNAWEQLAPGKTFGGMTLEQFRAVVTAALDARARIDDVEAQMTQALRARDSADEAALGKAQQLVNGVLADPTEGAESALYEAMGYTRPSDRKSGLHRNKSGGPAPPSAPPA